MRIVRKFRQDVVFRNRVFYTLAIFLSFTILGGIKSQLGPAFLDLQLISGVGIQQGSWIITCLYIGYTVGALCNGFLFTRFNPKLLFAAYCACIGVIMAIIPWCSSFPMMISAHLVLGIAQGLTDAGGNTAIIHMWSKENASIIVALHMIFNVGSVISPLIIASFLYESNQNLSEEVRFINGSFANATMYNNSTVQEKTVKPQSRIYVAFSISAVVCIFTAGIFVFLRNFNTNVDVGQSKETKEDSKKNKKEFDVSEVPRFLKIFALCVMVLTGTFSNGIDFAFCSYLTTFLVGTVGWTQYQGSFVTSLTYIAVVIGGSCGMVLSRWVKITIYEGINCTLLFVALLGLYVSATEIHFIGIWMSSFLFGFAKSVIFPLILSWTNNTFIHVSAKISSIFFVGAMGGSAINPLLLGYLMNHFTPLWFCYLFLIESILILILYIVAVVITIYVHRRFTFMGNTNGDAGNIAAPLEEKM